MIQIDRFKLDTIYMMDNVLGKFDKHQKKKQSWQAKDHLSCKVVDTLYKVSTVNHEKI